MKCFTIKATRQQYALVMAWCHQSEVVPHDYAGGGQYTPINIRKVIDCYASWKSDSPITYNVYVEEIEYMLLALRWPQYHLKV